MKESFDNIHVLRASPHSCPFSRFVWICVYWYYIYRDFLVDGLTIMKNRGYDSAGLATMAAEGGPMVSYFRS
jgi:hypothetical protein